MKRRLDVRLSVPGDAAHERLMARLLAAAHEHRQVEVRIGTSRYWVQPVAVVERRP